MIMHSSKMKLLTNRNINCNLFFLVRLLSENATLLQLYKDLVISKVISSEEFWAQHAPQFTKDQCAPRQEIGVSGAFLVCHQVRSPALEIIRDRIRFNFLGGHLITV